jgi:NitT/TauT family transport system substrate-binding protein
VQRFVSASIEGWYNYLYGDNAKANELIKADNPEMTDDQIAFSIEAMKSYGIVDSGDALTKGIGAMTAERWKSFFDKSVSWGVYPADLPIEQGYTLDFVNKGVGLELKKKLTGQ